MSILLSGHLCLGGNIVSDPVRVLAYMRAGLAGAEFNAAFSEHTCTTPGDISCASCYCQLLDDGPYSSPVADDAPWSDGSDAADEFLGFMATKISLDASVMRTLTPRSSVGSVLGPETLKHRIVQVEGMMVAASARGMDYGWRWLYDVTRGSGCGTDELTVLPACPEAIPVPVDENIGYNANLSYNASINYNGTDPFVLDETGYRHLRQVGLIDGPVPEAVVDKACLLQKASFQFAAGLPYLHAAPDVLIDTLYSPGQAFNGTITVPMWRYESALTFTVKNTGTVASAIARNIRIKVHPLADGETFDETYHNACVDIVIRELAAGETIVVDGIEEHVEILDPSAKTYVNGWNRLSFDGLFDWPVIAPCTRAAVTVWYDRPTGPNIQVKIESTLRSI